MSKQKEKPDKINFLRFYRLSNNLNQHEMAEVLGVAQSTISKVESGVLEPDYHMLRKMKLAFKIDLNKVFSLDGLSLKYSRKKAEKIAQQKQVA